MKKRNLKAMVIGGVAAAAVVGIGTVSILNQGNATTQMFSEEIAVEAVNTEVLESNGGPEIGKKEVKEEKKAEKKEEKKVAKNEKTEKKEVKKEKKAEAKPEAKPETKPEAPKPEAKPEAPKPEVKPETPTTETPAAEEPAEANTNDGVHFDSYQQAYADVLSKYQDRIAQYNWQHGVGNIDEHGGAFKTLTPASVLDVNGDGTPELVLVHSADEMGDVYAEVSIFTYAEDKTVRKIYNETIDVLAAGGTEYFFFTKAGSNTLCFYEHSLCQNESAGYYELISDETGNLVKVTLAAYDTDFSDGEGENLQGERVYYACEDEEGYKAKETEILGSITGLSVYNTVKFLGEELEQHLIFEVNHLFMSYEEAVAMMQ